MAEYKMPPSTVRLAWCRECGRIAVEGELAPEHEDAAGQPCAGKPFAFPYRLNITRAI